MSGYNLQDGTTGRDVDRSVQGDQCVCGRELDINGRCDWCMQMDDSKERLEQAIDKISDDIDALIVRYRAVKASRAELLKDMRFFHDIAKARHSDAAWRDVETIAANAIAKAEGAE